MKLNADNENLEIEIFNDGQCLMYWVSFSISLYLMKMKTSPKLVKVSFFFGFFSYSCKVDRKVKPLTLILKLSLWFCLLVFCF